MIENEKAKFLLCLSIHDQKERKSNMKYLKKLFFIITFSSLIFGMTAFASENIKVMGVDEQGKNPVIYIKGAQEIDAAQAVIGSVEASGVDIEKIAEKEVSMKTFILIDNSLSIPEKNRSIIKDIVSEVIAGRKNNEQFAIATFGEEIEILKDFSNDYIELKETINNIEFKDRETYLTDILYDLIHNNYLKGEDSCYTRIFVISDGVDNKSLGYTAEELSELLTEHTIPVYTLGVYNSKGSNDEELKKMFALSRQTNAEYFLLDEVEDYITVVSELAEDHEITSLEIYPDSQSKDGSEKTIQLELQTSGETVSVQVDNVRMSQEKVQQETVPVEKEVEPIAEEASGSKDTVVLILVGFLFVSVIAIMVTIIILVVRFIKKKKQEKEIVEIADPFKNELTETFPTEVVNDNPRSGGEGTVLLFDEIKKVKITLTDIDTPARSFTTDINGRIVIGRSASSTDICIDYDQSVSRKHCAIEMRNDKFYLIDLQSGNKTYLNENQVLSEIEISSGSVIKMGRVRMRVEMS